MSKTTAALAIKQSSNFTLIWNDKGSGGKYNAAFYQPQIEDGYYPLGSYGQSNYATPSGQVLLVKALEEGALANPVDYTLIWTDHHTGSDRNGSFWKPIAPQGYQALGTLAQQGYDKPALDAIKCVRQDLLVAANISSMIWNDKDTGGSTDFSAWAIEGTNSNALSSGTFLGVPIHTEPSSSTMAQCIDINATNLTPLTTQEALKDLIEKVAPVVYLHPDEKYLMTSVDWYVQRASLHDISNNTNTPATIDGLPTGTANENKYRLQLKNEADKGGDFSQAKVYVHAKLVDASSLDLQFWFFYAYNGPGTARIKSLVADTSVKSGNSSLAPMGEHEGDWEHITIRVNTLTKEVTSIYFSEHAGGQWVSAADINYENAQPVVYSSLNGHASYPYVSPNYSEHQKYPNPAIPAGLEFFLVNATDKGKRLNCKTAYELVAADFLPENERPKTPTWLNFLNRWGGSKKANLSEADVKNIVSNATGSVGKVTGLSSILDHIIGPILSHFVQESQDGPTAPKMKDNWAGKE